ncbi:MULTISPECIES: GNAT family N-acetyltransferase [Prochlorococcus]|uniref:GNAT family N-acetyltransferase n=1 Tax=Prochlorococcus TaxID=1218 RepID=UPI000533B86A|nr:MULTISPECIES: GNAT family N-acetyltransferase [Prochlorococcus]KGG13270.1 hypothetical protein EV05_0949 [Prochlorococcus sp. MIT 0601]
MSEYSVRWLSSIREIPEEYWQSLVGENLNPFFQWEWLKILESSDSISSKNGWQPIHLSIWKKNKPIGIALLYLKNHSYGEFIFDNVFVKVSQELKLRYYPKLIGMSPLSPIEGYKFFISSQEDENKTTKMMLDIIDEFAITNKILSCNFLYVDNMWAQIVKQSEYLAWINQQSLWESSGENNFSDYLARFNANQRRNIKRERKSIERSKISIRAITGNDVNNNILQTMHEFYAEHCSKWGVWGSKYLTKSFFDELALINTKNQIVLFSAYKEAPDKPLAMSFCMRNEEMLWGRYWGSKESIENLHFEVCYYSPIEWAINNGIKKFDPGAGGRHKKRRGFISTPRVSLHKWYNKHMSELLKAWLPKVNLYIQEEIHASNNEVPFKSNQIEL